MTVSGPRRRAGGELDAAAERGPGTIEEVGAAEHGTVDFVKFLEFCPLVPSGLITGQLCLNLLVDPLAGGGHFGKVAVIITACPGQVLVKP